MALDELDFDNSIATCSECSRHFHVPTEIPEPGRCKTCHGVLCGEGYQAAVRERRGECSTCHLAKQPEWEPPKPPVPEPSLTCSRGHLMIASNTYEWAGVLRCKQCKNIDRKSYDKKYNQEREKRKAAREGWR